MTRAHLLAILTLLTIATSQTVRGNPVKIQIASENAELQYPFVMKNVQLGAFGVNRVDIELQYVPEGVKGPIEIRLDHESGTPIARVAVVEGALSIVNQTIKAVQGGLHDVLVSLPSGLKPINVLSVTFHQRGIVKDKWYCIQSATMSNLVLDAPAVDHKFRNVLLFHKRCKEYQKFRFEEKNPGEYKIIAEHPGNVTTPPLEVTDITKKNGSTVTAFRGEKNELAQLWYLEAGNQIGTVKIRSKATSTWLGSGRESLEYVTLNENSLSNYVDWFFNEIA